VQVAEEVVWFLTFLVQMSPTQVAGVVERDLVHVEVKEVQAEEVQAD
jgi:hypothetical protein